MAGDHAFYNNAESGPKVVITDNCAAEKNALELCFPKIRLLLCIFHVLQAIWRYLWKSEHGVEKNHRNTIFQAFKRALYAEKETDFNLYFTQMMENEILKKYPKVRDYFKEYNVCKKDWALCFRTDLPIRGNNTNNYAESTMRILKEKIFHRKRAFNVVQLIDFIITRLDIYYQKKLVDFAIGKDTCVQKRYRLDGRKKEDFEIEKIADDSFEVTNLKKNSTYVIDLSVNICSCYVGITGAPCKHQAYVISKYRRTSDNFYISGNEQQRLQLHRLALGSTEDVPLNWYQPSHQSGFEQSHEKEEHIVEELVLSSSPSTLDPQAQSIPISEESMECSASGISDQKETNERENEIEDYMERFKEKVRTFTRSENGYKAAISFFKKFENFSTESGLENAFYNFGKSSRVSKNNITVQSTSVSRRKTKLGGLARIPSGRPPKRPVLADHTNYCRDKNIKKKSPHEISYCVRENFPPAT